MHFPRFQCSFWCNFAEVGKVITLPIVWLCPISLPHRNDNSDLELIWRFLADLTKLTFNFKRLWFSFFMILNKGFNTSSSHHLTKGSTHRCLMQQIYSLLYKHSRFVVLNFTIAYIRLLLTLVERKFSSSKQLNKHLWKNSVLKAYLNREEGVYLEGLISSVHYLDQQLYGLACLAEEFTYFHYFYLKWLSSRSKPTTASWEMSISHWKVSLFQ